MKIINSILLLTLAVFLAYGCSKPNSSITADTCKNPDAINYNKSGTCFYPKDNILAVANYNLRVTKYTLDPTQVGTVFQMEIRNSPCLNLADSFYKIIELHWNDGYFQPNYYCVVLNGYSFTIPANTSNFTWAGAPVYGTGVFSGNTFQFNGIVHSSNGDSVIVVNSY